MPQKPAPKTGFPRICSAFCYSVAGLRYGFTNATAFRQEVLLFVVLAIPLWLLSWPGQIKALLLIANTIVLIAELLNSALESVVDLASPDYHLLAKHAKDLGSAAVLLALLLAAGLWGWAIFANLP